MTELKVNEVPIEDTLCDTFRVHMTRMLITSVDRKDS